MQCDRRQGKAVRLVNVISMGVEQQVVEAPVVKVSDEIELTEQEEKIFEVLLATLQHFNLETELRVAGGWVRDKVSLNFWQCSVAFHIYGFLLLEFIVCLLSDRLRARIREPFDCCCSNFANPATLFTVVAN